MTTEDNISNNSISDSESLSNLPPIRETIELENNQMESILKDDFLVQRILDETHKTVYGEDDTLMALIVIISTRLVNNANPTSMNIVLSDEAGSGKDVLTKAICNTMLTENENYIHLRKMTNEVPNYWHNEDEEWSWDGKVLHIEDATDDMLNCQALKLFASGESKGVYVDKGKAQSINIKGKPVLILTSFSSSADSKEQIRRFPFIHLDTSEDLTNKVMKETANIYSGKRKIEKDGLLTKALNQLDRVSVKIPFADELVKYFPRQVVSRTYFRRFLDYICGSCALHQKQREKDDDGNLLATMFDYDLGRIAFIKTVSNATMTPLNREQEDLLNILIANGKPMFVSDLIKEMPQNKMWIYRTLNYLKDNGLVKQSEKYNDNANRNIATFEYSVVTGLSQGCNTSSHGCNIPPTDSSNGCNGCTERLASEILKLIDDANNTHKYNIYYLLCTTVTTVTTSEKSNVTTLLQPVTTKTRVSGNDINNLINNYNICKE
jgi:hypothetical protein